MMYSLWVPFVHRSVAAFRNTYRNEVERNHIVGNVQE